MLWNFHEGDVKKSLNAHSLLRMRSLTTGTFPIMCQMKSSADNSCRR